MDDMLYYAKAAAYISAAIAIGLGTLGPAWGQGTTGAKACESIGKNPESAPKVMQAMIAALISLETLAIFSFLIALLLLFAK
jgi:F-type H+-transporting ATPase subunit c